MASVFFLSAPTFIAPMEVRVFVRETRDPVGVAVEAASRGLGDDAEYVDVVDVKNGLPASVTVGCDPEAVAGKDVACTVKVFDAWENPAGALSAPSVADGAIS